MHYSLPTRFDTSLPLEVVAYRSWSAMKSGVMVWLWYLNVIYWIGFFHLDRPEGRWAVVAYLAVGPVIVMMVVAQRGLTRLSGLIHLPWVPFVLWLGLRLYTDALGPAVSSAGGWSFLAWLHLLFWSTLICLVLDVLDVARWLAGERYVIGTPAAHAAGASKLARTGA
ncbi:MAG: hypothetical protein ACNA7W_03390 [Pseudomonadales bacterium]